MNKKIVGVLAGLGCAVGCSGPTDESADTAMQVSAPPEPAMSVADVSALTQIAYIKASKPTFGANFGSGGSAVGDNAVSLSGDGMTLAVGAPYESSGSAGIDGDQSDESVFGAGAVYVFSDQDGEWGQQAYIKVSNPGVTDNFGFATSLSDDGNTLAVSAHFESSAATGINGDQDDDSIGQSGAAYVFVRDGSTWTQQAYIKASNTGSADIFGSRLAVSGDGNVLVVGAQFEDSDAQGINGPQDNDAAQEAGAVYLFTREGETWAQEAYVKGSNTETFDEFGSSVSISTDGSLIAIGAYLEDSGATGVGGDQSDNSVPDSGAVYLFRR